MFAKKNNSHTGSILPDMAVYMKAVNIMFLSHASETNTSFRTL